MWVSIPQWPVKMYYMTCFGLRKVRMRVEFDNSTLLVVPKGELFTQWQHKLLVYTAALIWAWTPQPRAAAFAKL